MDAYALHAKDAQGRIVSPGTHRTVLAYGEELMLARIAMDEGAVGAKHAHDNAQCTYVLEGAFTFYLGEKEARVEAGDTIYFPPRVLHGCVCLEKGVLLESFTPMRKDFV